jgi:hypothetical protein
MMRLSTFSSPVFTPLSQKPNASTTSRAGTTSSVIERGTLELENLKATFERIYSLTEVARTLPKNNTDRNTIFYELDRLHDLFAKQEKAYKQESKKISIDVPLRTLWLPSRSYSKEKNTKLQVLSDAFSDYLALSPTDKIDTFVNNKIPKKK